MTILAGAKIDAVDFDLPDVVTAFGNGANSITATTFSVLPATTCTAAVTNPHPTASMLTMVCYGAWMSSSTASECRMSLDVSGAVTIAAGVGGGAAAGWGEIPVSASTQPNAHRQAVITVELPPGTTTFKVYGMRVAASGTHRIDHPTVRLVPLRFLF